MRAASVILGSALLVMACGSRVSIGALAESKQPSEVLEEGTFPVDQPTAKLPSDEQGDASDDAPVTISEVDSGADAGWTPCGGKSCGDQCSVCPPDDVGCVETAVIKTCDLGGKCTPGSATCI